MRKNNKTTKYNMSKADVVSSLEFSTQALATLVLPTLEKFKDAVKKDSIIVNTLMFSKLKYKNDLELLTRIEQIIEDFIDSKTRLLSKVEEHMPEIVRSQTTNLNVRVLLSLVSTGSFLSMKVNLILLYLVDKHYSYENTLDGDIYRGISKDILSLVSLLENGKKVKFEEIIETIGRYPTVEFDKQNRPPKTVINGFIKNNFTNASKFLTNFVSKSFGTSDAGMVNVNFIGNPIYHIRLLITDYDVNQYEQYKNSKKLTELKLLELKSKDPSKDPSLKEQITYYENKLIKTQNKLDLFKED